MASQPIDSGPVTLINVFEVDTAHVEQFLASWRERAEFMSRQPGFRSFRIHQALSPGARFQLVNVAEWDSTDALGAATSRDEFQSSARESVEKFGVTAYPGIYRTVGEVRAR
jgi:heme oxygenase (mycobilin-producing)